MSGPVVHTVQGAVRGERRVVPRAGASTDHVSLAFRGIPYAAAPVGVLRFAAPQPPPAWEGVRDATAPGPTPQRRPLSDQTAIPEPSVPGESVLTVDVFTPAADPGAGLPVLVWIHGGGFVAGSPASPWYDGAAFTRDGVVTVSVSYRLGFEGLGLVDGAPANRAVLDWVAALRWVRENIRAFGGDPDRVTIAGQSAGGMAVLTLLCVPRARGLFQRAIAVSPGGGTLTPEAARRTTERLAAAAGVGATLDELAALDPDRLLDAQEALDRDEVLLGVEGAASPAAPSPDLASPSPATATVASTDSGSPAAFPSTVAPGSPVASPSPATAPDRILAAAAARWSEVSPFAPVADGEVLPVSVLDGLRSGMASGIPLLIGATAHEFAEVLDGHAAELQDLTAEEILRGLGLPAGAVGLYARRWAGRPPVWVGGQLITDRVFRRPVAALAAAHSRHSAGRTWLYDFRWAPRPQDGPGASHCADLPFAWDLLDPASPGHAASPEHVLRAVGPDAPQALADQVHGSWVRFVHGEDPGWGSYGSRYHRVRVYDRTTRTVRDGYRFERLAGTLDRIHGALSRRRDPASGAGWDDVPEA